MPMKNVTPMPNSTIKSGTQPFSMLAVEEAMSVTMVVGIVIFYLDLGIILLIFTTSQKARGRPIATYKNGRIEANVGVVIAPTAAMRSAGDDDANSIWFS